MSAQGSQDSTVLSGGADAYVSQMADGGPLKSLADLMLLGDEYSKRPRFARAARQSLRWQSLRSP